MMWLLVLAYVAGTVPAALLLYPEARRERMEAPHFAAAFFSLFWPALVALAVAVAPIWLLGRLVKAVRG